MSCINNCCCGCLHKRIFQKNMDLLIQQAYTDEGVTPTDETTEFLKEALNGKSMVKCLPRRFHRKTTCLRLLCRILLHTKLSMNNNDEFIVVVADNKMKNVFCEKMPDEANKYVVPAKDIDVICSDDKKGLRVLWRNCEYIVSKPKLVIVDEYPCIPKGTHDMFLEEKNIQYVALGTPLE